MTSLTWDELAERAWQLEEAGQFAASLALITPNKHLFPSQGLFYGTQLRCAAHVGEGAVVEVMRTALDEGYWFDEMQLRHEPALAPMLEQPAVAALLAVSNERRGEAQAGSGAALLAIQPPAASPPYPALLALHGAGSSIAASVEHWQPLVRHGWLVALAQSSQVGGAEGYVWNDTQRARDEITGHVAALRAGYALDGGRFVLGGFSMGGGLAIELVLSGAVPSAGFFAVAPFVPDLDALVEQLKTGAPHGVRGSIVVGEEDYGCLEIARTLGEQLPLHGIACEVEVVPQVGHWFPPDFGRSLARGLAFIQARS
jgi:predicted esterase